MKAPLARILLLFALAWCALVAQGAPLQTPENTILLVPAATVAAGGIPGSTNLAGSEFMMSAVATATSGGGSASLINIQQWVNRFTNNATSFQSGASAMALRPDGGIVETGYSYGPTNGFNFLTLCYAADGTELWTNFYDGPNHGDDTAAYIAAGTNGVVWVTGESIRYATNFIITDAALVCYASNGVSLWTNRYASNPTNSDSPTGLVVDRSGNAYLNVMSVYWPPSGGGTPVGDTIIKFDPLGNPVWTNAFPAAAPDSGQAPHDAEATALDATGDLFVAGITGSQNINTGSAVVKFAGDGTPLWTNYQAFGYLALFRTVIIDPQGDVIATGEGRSTNNALQYVVTKYSGVAGNPLWTNTLAGPNYDGGGVPQTLVTPTGDSLLVGGAVGTSFLGLYQVMKMDRNGIPLWTNLSADFGTNASGLDAATVDDAGELYLAGHMPDPINNSADFVTVKYSNSGEPVWTNLYDGPAGLDDYPSAVAVNGRGEVFVSGQSTGLDGAFEFATVEYADLLSYAPPTNFVGLDTISYMLTDAFGNSAAGSVQVSVASTNFQVVPMGTGPSPAGFQLEVEGAPGTNVVIIEASFDLVHWQPVYTNAPIVGTVQFLDTSAPGLARRFYRAEQQP
jgi:hypothetical protein